MLLDAPDVHDVHGVDHLLVGYAAVQGIEVFGWTTSEDGQERKVKVSATPNYLRYYGACCTLCTNTRVVCLPRAQRLLLRRSRRQMLYTANAGKLRIEETKRGPRVYPKPVHSYGSGEGQGPR